MPSGRGCATFWDALRPLARNGGSYVNFMTEHDEDRVRASYGPAKYDRLAQIKATVRPRQRLPPQREHQAGTGVRSDRLEPRVAVAARVGLGPRGRRPFEGPARHYEENAE